MHTPSAPAIDPTVLPGKRCVHRDAVAMPTLRYALPRRGTRRHDPRGPVEVQCMNGTLWVTIDREPQDIVLVSGQCLTLWPRRPVFITALEDAVVQIAAMPGSRPRTTWLQRAAALTT